MRFVAPCENWKKIDPFYTDYSLTAILVDAFDPLPDPRVARTRLHRWADVLLLSLATFCCGAEGFEDIEDTAKTQGERSLRHDFGIRLDDSIPHHGTFCRVLGALNRNALETRLHLLGSRKIVLMRTGEV